MSDQSHKVLGKVLPMSDQKEIFRLLRIVSYRDDACLLQSLLANAYSLGLKFLEDDIISSHVAALFFFPPLSAQLCVSPTLSSPQERVDLSLGGTVTDAVLLECI